VRVHARSAAAAPLLWHLAAAPRWWPVWAPHLRRVRDTDGVPVRGEVALGDRLRIDSVAPLVGVHAEVTRVDPGRRWDFVVDLPGPWRLVSAHHVAPLPRGSRVTVALWLEGPAGGVVGWGPLRAYRPLAAWAVRRLAALADQHPEPRG